MMKKLSFLLCLLVSINNLHAQSTFTGSAAGINDEIYIINHDYSSNADAVLRLGTSRPVPSVSSYGSWNIFNEYGNSNLHFSFSESDNNKNIGERYMTLTSYGNLGIGVTLPNNKLDVAGGIDINDYIRHNNDESTHIGFPGVHQIRLRTAGVDRLAVTSSGNVGIGTTSPGNKLDVAGGIDINDYIRHNGDVNTYIGFPSNDQIRLRTNGADRMTVTSSGDIGIGTTSPENGKIHVYKNATTGGWSNPIDPSGAGIHIEDKTYHMYLDGNSIFTDGSMNLGTSAETNLTLGTNNTERLRITNAGVVGIGTSNPSNGLVHIYKNATTGSWGEVTKADAGLRIQDSSNNMYLDGNGIYSTGSVFLGTLEENDYVSLGTMDAERMRITASGNVGLGTKNPAEKLSVIGKLNLTHSMDETVDYLKLYHNGEHAAISTEEGALHLNRGTEKYLIIEDLGDRTARIRAYDEDTARTLSLRARPIPPGDRSQRTTGRSHHQN